MTRVTFLLTPLVMAALTLAGCSEGEAGPEEDHTPVEAALFIADVAVTGQLLLEAGETVRIEVRFLDDEGNEITGIEDDHHAALTFSPEGLATAASVAGANFQKDVTAQGDVGTGTVVVGYGHDEGADEIEFDPFPVSVVATGAAR